MSDPQFEKFDIGARVFAKGIQENNYVKTTRYSVLTFIPLTIFENFRRLANIYFLIIAIVSMFPWSPVTPVVQIIPIVFVVSVSMIKTLIEDLYRYQTDKKNNSVKVGVFRKGLFRQIKSQSIRPGDIIKIGSAAETPCDILILSSSEPNGRCFVNEVNLNGETAIKQRKALSIQTLPQNLKATITIPIPCKDLQSLDGTITTPTSSIPFTMKNCILRGTYPCHTKSIIGIALYTGHDTRIIQNQRHPPLKISHLESKLNMIIAIDFAANFFLVFLSAFLSFSKDASLSFHWVQNDPHTIITFLKYFSSFAIIFSYMIPISLYVTIEFVRFFQRWIFSSDLGMYHAGLGFCQAKNSNLNEELGQVDIVFSDKTGTLTENIMKFVRISAKGKVYDIANEKIKIDEDLIDIFRCITLCNSVNITADGVSSESPDEEALVNYSAELGAKLIARDELTVIEINGVCEKYQTIALFEFDSDRKRMSVLTKNEAGEMILFVKGADSIMFPLTEDNPYLRTTEDHVNSFAEEGLRTLVLGFKKVSASEWNAISERYKEASLSLNDRDSKVKHVGSELENNLMLLGAVAIEDKLQPNVPETMGYLSQMGIKLWILTGDKQETAVSIAKSTNVITPSSEVIYILKGNEDVRQQLEQSKESVLVISNNALQYIVDHSPNDLAKFSDICRSVVCFRMSPYLKSKVVETVKEQTKKVCLAIGDGANDVNMIQTANVGVGIIGREGRQAASSSDYAITRFKHLKRLMCVHGRLSLVRLSGVIRYMIYKNMVFCLPQLWYFMFTNWSPTPIFDGWLMSTYNLLWTLFPPGEYGFFEQDVSFTSMMKYPVIYREAKSGRYLTIWKFVMEVANATYQSLVLFFVQVYIPSLRSVNSRGFTDGRSTAGFSLFVAIVMVVDIQTVIRSQNWNVFLFLGVVISILIFFLLILPYGSFASYIPSMFFVPQVQLTMVMPYVLLILSLITCLAPEAIISYMKGMWKPSFTRIIREAEIIDLGSKRHNFIVNSDGYSNL